MKKFALGIAMLIISNGLLAGPVVEVYECTLNEGKTIVDANNMMGQFSSYIEDAGLNYTAHLVLSAATYKNKFNKLDRHCTNCNRFW